MHAAGIAVLAAFALLLILAVTIIFSVRWRRRAPRIAGLVVGGLLAVYAVARGVAEFWTVSYSDPASYRQSWGGPSLAGVLAVHSGPGLVVLIAAAAWLRRRMRQRRLGSLEMRATEN